MLRYELQFLRLKNAMLLCTGFLELCLTEGGVAMDFLFEKYSSAVIDNIPFRLCLSSITDPRCICQRGKEKK